MPRTVAYRAGGFTNYGISYTKFSQEELAEMKERAMTERLTNIGTKGEIWIADNDETRKIGKKRRHMQNSRNRRANDGKTD